MQKEKENEDFFLKKITIVDIKYLASMTVKLKFQMWWF